MNVLQNCIINLNDNTITSKIIALPRNILHKRIRKQYPISSFKFRRRKIYKEFDKQYKQIFFREGDDLSFTNKIKHEINTSNVAAVYSKTYRYPEVHKTR